MSNDTLTPPPAAPPSTPPAAPKVVTTLLIVLGAIVIAWTLVSGALTTLAAAPGPRDTQTLPVAGVTRLEVDASRTDLKVVFADVDQATLEVSNWGRGVWQMTRDGDRLRVASPDVRWFSWPLFGGGGHATLTLPERLSGVDAKLSLTAGSLTASGSFGALSTELAAGQLTVAGSARTLDATVSAGSADLTLADVRQARLTLAAGELVSRLTGTAPDRTTVEVSAGSLELTLPDVPYALRSDVSAGSLDHERLTTSPAASRSVSVEVSAGSATLRGK